MNSVIAAPTLAALTERLCARGFAPLDASSFDEFASTSGNAVVLFADDPTRGGETWDVAVVLPEVLRGMAAPVRTGFLLPDAARRVQPRYGFATWPALLFLRDGDYVGDIEGMRDWDVYQREIGEMLVKPTTRPPTLGIAVRGGDASDKHCH
jgi:hydrogenase-1 operon protein HyaE